MEQVGSILSVGFIGFAMRAFWLDPYLWIHLAGLAALPIFLELCLLGLAIGDPILPVWLELLLVAVVGIAPVLWMQWQRPFYIFSIVAVALKPEQLTEDQRRLLTLFKSQRNRLTAGVVTVGLLLLVRWMYGAAAIASEVAPALPGGRATGLLLAAVAFLGSNLFLQVPVSVAGVMLTGQSDFAKLAPYAPDQIRQSFTSIGLQIRQILPPIMTESPLATDLAGVASVSTASELAQEPDSATAPIGAELKTELQQLETEITPNQVAPETPQTSAEISPVESSDSSTLIDPTQD